MPHKTFGPATTAAAHSVAANLPEDVKQQFDPISIITVIGGLITTLMQLFQSCKQPNPPAMAVGPPPGGPDEDAQSYINDHYEDGEYDTLIVWQAQRHARQEARAEEVRLRPRQAKEMGIAALDHCRTADVVQVAAVGAEAAGVVATPPSSGISPQSTVV